MKMQPEYKSWSLEKLQSEYKKLVFIMTAKDIQLTQAKDKVQKVEAFLDAFRDILAVRDEE